MDFQYVFVGGENIRDDELELLLVQVYVDGGFTELNDAKTLFDPVNVRARGSLVGVRDTSTDQLAGVVILVHPGSTACRLANGNEAEMQLLGVAREYRNKGIGRHLVDSVLSLAQTNGYSKVVLWTQSTMSDAQKLYSSFGFSIVDEFQRNNRNFIVYSLAIA